MKSRPDSASSSSARSTRMLCVHVARLGWAACFAFLVAAGPAAAKVFFTQKEAVALAFPDSDRIESKTHLIDSSQADEIQRRSRAKLDSRIAQFYTGYRGDEVLGYAYIDVHNVRTLPEAFLVVMDPDGTITSMRVLAFHEPLDYLPTDRWIAQFEQKTGAEPLRLGGDIHGIAGSTLSARAVTASVRRVLAFYAVLLAPDADGAEPKIAAKEE